MTTPRTVRNVLSFLRLKSVSYTHLDVYKRQAHDNDFFSIRFYGTDNVIVDNLVNFHTSPTNKKTNFASENKIIFSLIKIGFACLPVTIHLVLT